MFVNCDSKIGDECRNAKVVMSSTANVHPVNPVQFVQKNVLVIKGASIVLKNF